MGVAAFWIALAAVLIAGKWLRYRSEAVRHETFRRIVERTGAVNEEQLRLLFNPAPAYAGGGEPQIRIMSVHTGLRIFGTFSLFLALGLLAFFAIFGYWVAEEPVVFYIGIASAAAIAIVGVGAFLASLFTKPPGTFRAGDSPMD
jgi:hypothetical protein